MKPLIQIPATDAAALRARLAEALDGGPAIWPVPGGADGRADREARGDEVGRVGDGVAVVVETSGSTAAPKRVLLSASALRASADATTAALGGHGRWVLAVPGHYIAGVQVLVRSILAGTPIVALADGPFAAGPFVDATIRVMRTRDARPRFTSLVPVQLARLVEAAEAEGDADGQVARAIRAYSAILVGGQRVDPVLAARAAALGARIVRTYGSSETAGGCVYDGRPLPGVLVREVDGQLELGGPTLADGYLADPARTAAAFTADPDGTRWYRTGDLGTIGADGLLRVTGRADDVIISGGVKVVLGEVERAVHEVAGFGDAVVVGVADPDWGERPAVVTTAPAADIADSSLALAALGAVTDAAGLPPAGRPVRLVVVEELPRLASGKPDRVAASALARSAADPAAG